MEWARASSDSSGSGLGTTTRSPGRNIDAIRNLPTDAKIAYECQPFEEHSVWDPRLESIDAHTGRRAITMCFHADAVGPMIGGPVEFAAAEAPFFGWRKRSPLSGQFDRPPS